MDQRKGNPTHAGFSVKLLSYNVNVTQFTIVGKFKTPPT